IKCAHTENLQKLPGGQTKCSRQVSKSMLLLILVISEVRHHAHLAATVGIEYFFSLPYLNFRAQYELLEQRPGLKQTNKQECQVDFFLWQERGLSFRLNLL